MLGYVRWLMGHLKTLYLTLKSKQTWEKLKAECEANKAEFLASLRVLCTLIVGSIGLVAVAVYTKNTIVSLIAAFLWLSYLFYSLELLDEATRGDC